MKTLRVFVMLAVAAAVAFPLMAADQKAPVKKAPKCPAAAYAEKMLQGVKITDEQKCKLAEVQKEFGPKLMDFAKKRDAILTPEQRKAAVAATKAAIADGKKGKELWKAVGEATKPTPEQKQQLAEVQKERAGVEKELRGKIEGVLTPEQKEELKKLQPAKKAKGK